MPAFAAGGCHRYLVQVGSFLDIKYGFYFIIY